MSRQYPICIAHIQYTPLLCTPCPDSTWLCTTCPVSKDLCSWYVHITQLYCPCLICTLLQAISRLYWIYKGLVNTPSVQPMSSLYFIFKFHTQTVLQCLQPMSSLYPIFTAHGKRVLHRYSKMHGKRHSLIGKFCMCSDDFIYNSLQASWYFLV